MLPVLFWTSWHFWSAKDCIVPQSAHEKNPQIIRISRTWKQPSTSTHDGKLDGPCLLNSFSCIDQDLRIPRLILCPMYYQQKAVTLSQDQFCLLYVSLEPWPGTLTRKQPILHKTKFWLHVPQTSLLCHRNRVETDHLGRQNSSHSIYQLFKKVLVALHGFSYLEVHLQLYILCPNKGSLHSAKSKAHATLHHSTSTPHIDFVLPMETQLSWQSSNTSSSPYVLFPARFWNRQAHL